MAKASRTERTFRGVLECPLRKEYIEFEYCSGDTVRELRRAVVRSWGAALPKDYTIMGFYGSQPSRQRGWAILVEDCEGTYQRLHDSEEIPVAPPASSGTKAPDVLGDNLRGLIEDARHDCEAAGGPEADLQELSEADTLIGRVIDEEDVWDRDGEVRLSIELRIVRDGYALPAGSYDVHLVALATLVGG